MSAIKLKIKNLRKLRSRISNFPEVAGKHVSKAINKTIIDIEAKAKPITPVKTGRLVGSYAFGQILSTPRTLRGRVKPNVFYAGFVHDLHKKGEKYIKPSRPGTLPRFLEIGVDRSQAKVDKNFQEAANNITRDLGD